MLIFNTCILTLSVMTYCQILLTSAYSFLVIVSSPPEGGGGGGYSGVTRIGMTVGNPGKLL